MTIKRSKSKNTLKMRSKKQNNRFFLSLFLLVGLLSISTLSLVSSVQADTQTYGNTNRETAADIGRNYVQAYKVDLTEDATIVKVYMRGEKSSGHFRIGIYDDDSNYPGSKLYASGELSLSPDWIEHSLSSPLSLSAGTYWIVTISDTTGYIKRSNSVSGEVRYYKAYSYNDLPDTYPTGGTQKNQRTSKYMEGETGPNFSLQVTPTGRSINAGDSTDYGVTVSVSSGFNDAVDLSVSGLPGGSTYSWTSDPVAAPGSSTLAISTSTTTPGGSYTLTITGSGGGKTHTATVSLTINGPEGFTFDVRDGASQIFITASWTTITSGSSITIRIIDPNGVTIEEAGMSVYDKLTIQVGENGDRMYTGLKRVAYPAIPDNIQSGEWTLLISKSGITDYIVDIEVT